MDLEAIHNQLTEHTESDRIFQKSVGDNIEAIKKTTDKSLNNHLAHMQPLLEGQKIDIAVMKFQIKILLASAGAILLAILGLALK